MRKLGHIGGAGKLAAVAYGVVGVVDAKIAAAEFRSAKAVFVLEDDRLAPAVYAPDVGAVERRSLFDEAEHYVRQDLAIDAPGDKMLAVDSPAGAPAPADEVRARAAVCADVVPFGGTVVVGLAGNLPSVLRLCRDSGDQN